MPRSPLFAALSRVRRLVHAADARGLPVEAALEAEAAHAARVSRRRVLGGAAALGVFAGAAPLRAATGGQGNGNGAGSGAGASVGIVGAGLAGLNAAFTLEVHHRVARATLGPPGLAPLEDPALADQVEAVQEA